jgi:hypothetical protein
MTANELADKLDLIRIELTIQAATMLRQQQAEIESLKMRELTDEEILEVWKEHYGDVNISNFARAILQKASEK